MLAVATAAASVAAGQQNFAAQEEKVTQWSLKCKNCGFMQGDYNCCHKGGSWAGTCARSDSERWHMGYQACEYARSGGRKRSISNQARSKNNMPHGKVWPERQVRISQGLPAWPSRTERARGALAVYQAQLVEQKPSPSPPCPNPNHSPPPPPSPPELPSLDDVQLPCQSSPSLARELTDRWILRAPQDAARLRPQAKPSVAEPLVFYHLRKSGGSFMRAALWRSRTHVLAPTEASHHFIPCMPAFHPEISCETYSPPIDSSMLKPYAILAGHFYRPLIERWSQQRVANTWQVGVGMAARPKYACLTIVRETAARFESCWNFRFIQQAGLMRRQRGGGLDVNGTRDGDESGAGGSGGSGGGGGSGGSGGGGPSARSPRAEPRGGGLLTLRPLSAMSADGVEAVLAGARSKFAEGCNNEAARMFASVGGDESLVNTLTSNGDKKWRCEALPALGDVLSHTSRCVVGVLERCADTMANVRHFLPWLAPFYNCSRGAVRPGKLAPLSGALDAKTRALIEKHNAIDRYAYEHANALLDAQLDVARRADARKVARAQA